MKKYTSENPSFSEEIDIYENTDPVDADSVSNKPLKQLQDNVLWLKENGGGASTATEEEVRALAEELMADAPTPEPGGAIATDEEVEEAIENLDDL